MTTSTTTRSSTSLLLRYYRKTDSTPTSIKEKILTELNQQKQKQKQPSSSSSSSSSLWFDRIQINDIMIESEYCFYVDVCKTSSSGEETPSEETTTPLNPMQMQRLEWLLGETFNNPTNNDSDNGLRFEKSYFDDDGTAAVVLVVDEGDDGGCKASSTSTISWILEVGPRLTFTTPFSSNAVSICKSCDLSPPIQRLEKSRRYQFHCTYSSTLCTTSTQSQQLNENGLTTPAAAAAVDSALEQVKSIVATLLHDRMTECIYTEPLYTFDSGIQAQPVRTIPIMEHGRKALEELNTEMGLGFDDFDLDYYTKLFQHSLGRNPTDVECFDMGQSNSEHSRHWFFAGKMIIDGIEKPNTLFQMVKATLNNNETTPDHNNSIIAFHDNSSCIRGYQCTTPIPSSVDQMEAADQMGQAAASNVRTSSSSDLAFGPYKLGTRTWHPILTAETHNFPSGVAPFPGAETGTGGRLRDVMATGRGAHPVAGICGYCVGKLNIPGYELPWEQQQQQQQQNDVDEEQYKDVYPSNLASPLQIIIEASDGASDYGNKYGEPVIHGFVRSFGQRLPSSSNTESRGERFEWVKPIMFSAGVGQIDGRHTTKGIPEPGMLVVKVGGPAYRIGMGGGAASSRVQSGQHADLDFNAVQRGDAEMENRLNRLIRACIDLGTMNPIVSIHDQGAGGNGNVLKEIVEPAGAKYDIRKVYVGDETLSVLEIWGAEYQENNALLIQSHSKQIFEQLAGRENCPIRILGVVTGDGRVVVEDSNDNTTPVDLPLELVLGKMPQKTFIDDHVHRTLKPLILPEGTTVMMALDRVLRLLSVGSKRFLVNKVDRSVTGLCAQQQCVGPLQIPLSNVGVTAHSHFGITGTAVACGEQPIKGLVNSSAMARMTVAEAMTNIMWAKISNIKHIKASGNWMYAAKLPGEGAKMYDACEALRDALISLGVGIDGGKDSLSMAARCGDEVVKAPGELTLTCYVTCPDITKTITPDLKCVGGSHLLFVDLGCGNMRLGGCALAQVYSQTGDVSPDVDDFDVIKNAFLVTQDLIAQRMILSGHDRSDGGLVVALLEMAFAGNCSIDVMLPSADDRNAFEVLFNEEAGIIIEVDDTCVREVMELYKKVNLPVHDIGRTSACGDFIKIAIGDDIVVDDKMTVLRDVWEATSFHLERRQRNPECVKQEEAGLKFRTAPQWKLTYTPNPTNDMIMSAKVKHKVAVVRQEGSNGDLEMISAFLAAGFEPWDVTMSDLIRGKVNLEIFRGIAFVGGFSFADVLDSGKGWAAVVKFNQNVIEQFEKFRRRNDTFSLGVCNGCQLMALLGWVPSDGIPEKGQPRFLHNTSGRYESRFVSVQIQASSAIMLKGMEGSSLGVWVAHGEGRVYFPDDDVKAMVIEKKLAPIRYVNDVNETTEDYPFNPNGSPLGIAALCSADGRHLALMPHPERVFQPWQWPWMPLDWKSLRASPWLQMFQNARTFCDYSS